MKSSTRLFLAAAAGLLLSGAAQADNYLYRIYAPGIRYVATSTAVVTPTYTALGANPLSLSFGSVSTGQSASSTFTLSNSGTGGTTSLAFTLPSNVTQTNTCGSAVAAGANCLVTVKYSPTVTGTLSGNLTVSSQDSSVQVGLSGTAVSATSVITVTSATYGGNCSGVPVNNELTAVGNLCNNQTTCSGEPWPLNNNVDPSPGCLKGFSATWTCLGATGTKSVALPAEAQYKTFTMSCP
jgi:hypothetical protein